MSIEKFAEFRKELDNYTYFLFSMGAIYLAQFLPPELASVMLVLAGVGIEKAKKV